MSSLGPSSPRRARAQGLGLALGPLLALGVYALLPTEFVGVQGEPVPFTHAGRATLAVLVWMATWWLTEAIAISATALLPIALFPLLGVGTVAEASAPYARDLIFLFMGGFMLALAMQRWGLDRRIALSTLRLVGTRPAAMIGGFMLVTAVLSMWVSNTATTAMMLPIALSVVDLVVRQESGVPTAKVEGLAEAGRGARNFALSLMLGIAYAASIGGIATVIGSPPNGILVQYLEDAFGVHISFAQWMRIGGPFALVFLPLAWVLITWVLYPIPIRRIEGGGELVGRELAGLGPMQRGEWIVLGVFLLTATLWITRPLLVSIEWGSGADPWRPLAGLSDSGIAILAGLALFATPVRPRERVFALDWPTAVQLPWGILLLFGGGLSLAAAVEANGVAEFFGSQALLFRGVPTWVLVLAVTTAVIFLTELTSNTATTATLVPILAGLSPGLGVAPEMLIFPATIAASCAFMMPVATPPNAIVFGSGYITIPQMCRAGLWLNLLGVVLVTGLMYLVLVPLLRLDL